MMNHDFDYLLELPGASDEQAYIKERLETLSVREGYVLAAAAMRHPPKDASEVVDCLHSLDRYEIYFPARNYAELGERSLQESAKLPKDALPYANLEWAGELYGDAHPGLFIGSCYVCYPTQTPAPVRQEDKLFPLWDSDWSVKLKLASPAVPEGVWLRLPGHDGKFFDKSDEVVLALDELKVKSLEDCTLLEARCILPEAGDLTKQYSSIMELVRDGEDLGNVMEDQDQGEPYWMEKFTAALEYEDCRTLKFALDIWQNLSCYEWVDSEELGDFAVEHLRSVGVLEDLIQSCCIDLEGYAKDLLETSGYMEASGERGYLLRNTREFIYNYSTPEGETLAPQDILTAFPFLEQLFSHASPEETDAARRSISKSLAGQGQDGVRRLQAAMEYEDCAKLSEAAEIAARLDSYEFMEIGSFRETAKQDLLEKGLDKRVVDIYTSRDTGLYVHKNDAMSQPEQGGMTMQ